MGIETRHAVKRVISIIITISMLSSFCILPAAFSITAKADNTTASDAPDANCITVKNNAKGTSDTIYVCSLCPKDVVKVYTAQTGGKLLGSITVSSSGSEATVTISQLGSAAGSVYVSVTSTDCTESSRTEADYAQEPVSEAPIANNITVTNNAKGTADTVYVCGLSASDIVKVYNAATSGKQIGSKTTSSSDTDATVSISQLGSGAGSIYVSVTSTGHLESSRTEADYDEEPGSDEPVAENITVTNNASGIADTVYVSALSAKDVVKVYNAQTGGKLLGSKTVATAGSDATVSITQFGSNAGSVYVSVTSSGCTESSRTMVSYLEEATSDALDANQITVTNNPKGTADTVYVTGLTAKDIIRVYDAETNGKLLGSATVGTAGNSVTVSISQLGAVSGSVYVSIKTYGDLESNRAEADYDAELVTTAPDSSKITVTNNAKGTADTIYVQNLSSDDTVKVYSTLTGNAMLGTATSTGTNVTVSIAQLGTAAGAVYVSVTGQSMSESSRVEADYDAEPSSTAPSAANIIVTNNPTGTSDTVRVSGLNASDVVKIYNKASSGTILGTATVASLASTGTVSITQLGTIAGSVYVSVTSTGKAESSRTEMDYEAEKVSTAPVSSNITVTNNAAGTADTVYITGLQENDVVNVYRTVKKGTALGTSTVASGTTYATVSISQLGTATGSIYVTVTSADCLESSCTAATYSAEAQTTALSSSSVSVTNNYEVSDVVTVTGLTYGDIIKVYDSATGGTLLGTDTVSTYSSTATITIKQLGTTSGYIYVSKTSTGDTESLRTVVSYEAEPKSTVPSASNITITNNASSSDTIAVIGLLEGDVVTVYKTDLGSNTWGKGTVAASSSTATITVAQLGTTSGSVYISVTSTDASESSRTAATYLAETPSTAPSASNATVANNYNIASTITVTGLANNDVVDVYNVSSGGTLLGTGTVSTYGTSVTISLSSLTASGGTIYLTVTSTNQSESPRTAVTYSAQSVSTAPSASDVTVVNNADIADTISVKNMSKGAIIEVYDAKSGGNLMGTATSGGTSVIMSIDQIGSSSGTVYITATTSGKTESVRTAVTYTAESASDPIQSGNVKIVNNSGAADTITITGLSNGDVVKVYKASSGGTAISTTTATGSLSTVISISQLGTSSGSIYLTVTTSGETESNRTEIDYLAESKTPTSSEVAIVNNAGISDTITVTGLNAGDIVNVYSDSAGKTMLGTATAALSSMSATITASQLSSAAGYVYISFINSGCAESSLTKVSYLAEQTTDSPDEGDIYIENNSGTSDTITVGNLNSGDVVKVYDAASDGNLLGKATAASGSTSATVTISELGTSSGSVYVSVKTKGKLESDTTEVCYSAESQATAPYSGYIKVENNAAISDTVTVTGLNATNLVKVYNASSSGTLLGDATVTSGSTSVKISIAQLGAGSGAVYVSVTEVGKTESNRTKTDYVAESQSGEISLSSVAIVNNAVGTADTITVTGLTSGDVIQVYDKDSGGNLLVSGVASLSGTVIISVSQLGSSAGSVYITCTGIGKSESDRLKVSYASE